MMRRVSIRLRLTFWYGAVLSTVLVAFSASVYLLMRHYLLALTDAGLAEELTELADEIRLTASPYDLGPRYAQHEGYELQVATREGRVLFRGDRLGPEGLPRVGLLPSTGETVFSTHELRPLGRLRQADRAIAGPDGPLVIQAATSLEAFDAASRELLAIVLLSGTTAVGGSLGVGYLLARKALAPVDRMVAEAAEITASRLDRRLEAPCAEDEVGRLARTLNDMIERLEKSFTRVRQFTADAAHELRTPLAVIRSSAEVALRAPTSPDQDRRTFEEILDETDRLGRIVAQLLDLCRGEQGRSTEIHYPIRMDELVCEVVDLMKVAGDEKRVFLAVDEFAACRVRGDADRIRQLIINLLDNAIKHTTTGGTVTVRGVVSEGWVRVEVIDTGVGIPPEHLSHVFERFYRVDAARSRAIEGAGLGLSICRSIVEAHQGRIWIESEPGRGTQVTFELPCDDLAHSEHPASVDAA